MADVKGNYDIYLLWLADMMVIKFAVKGESSKDFTRGDSQLHLVYHMRIALTILISF